PFAFRNATILFVAPNSTVRDPAQLSAQVNNAADSNGCDSRHSQKSAKFVSTYESPLSTSSASAAQYSAASRNAPAVPIGHSSWKPTMGASLFRRSSALRISGP